jgi:hypothetical protein
VFGKIKNATAFHSFNDELESLFQDSLQGAIDGLSDEDKIKFAKLEDKDLQDILQGFINTVSDSFQQSIRKDKAWHRIRSRTYGIGFRRRLRKRWAGYIDEYELLIRTCVESVAKLRDNIGDTETNDSHLGMLIRLHARCLRISNEVLTLSMNGYGNAALARWRSLHETTVTTAAVAKLGKQASDAFIAYNAVESHKAMVAFNDYAPQLGERKFTSRQIAAAKKARDKAVAKYGKQIQEEFGWAEMYTKGHKGQFKFRQLEKHYGSEFLRPYYRWSSYAVHTNVKTILTGEQSDALSKNGVILIGASDSGFEDALQLSALSLAHATVAVLTAYPNLENLALAQAIIKYERKTNDTFGRFFQKNKNP